MVADVQNFVIVHGWPGIKIAAAIDAEPCFIPKPCSTHTSNYSRTMDWVKTYSNSSVSLLYDYGSTDGYPCYDANTQVPGGACSKWTAEQIFQLSWAVTYAYPLPEVYHAGYARDWYYVTGYGVYAHGSKMLFAGEITECGDASCPPDYTPNQGWQTLWLKLNTDARTQQGLPSSTDIGYIQ